MRLFRRLAAWDRRNREKRWYVFLQVYLLAGVFTTTIVYLIALVFAADLFAGMPLIMYVSAAVVIFLVPPIAPLFWIPSCLLAVVVVFLRYLRLYRRESHV